MYDSDSTGYNSSDVSFEEMRIRQRGDSPVRYEPAEASQEDPLLVSRLIRDARIRQEHRERLEHSKKLVEAHEGEAPWEEPKKTVPLREIRGRTPIVGITNRRSRYELSPLWRETAELLTGMKFDVQMPDPIELAAGAAFCTPWCGYVPVKPEVPYRRPRQPKGVPYGLASRLGILPEKKSLLLDAYEEHCLKHGSPPKDSVITHPKYDPSEDEITPVVRPFCYASTDTLLSKEKKWNIYFQEFRGTLTKHVELEQMVDTFCCVRAKATRRPQHQSAARAYHNYETHIELPTSVYEKFKDHHPKLFRNPKFPMSVEETRAFFKSEFYKYNTNYKGIIQHSGGMLQLFFRAAVFNLFVNSVIKPEQRVKGIEFFIR